MKLQPIEEFIYSGFAKRYYQVFNAIPVMVTAFDKAKAVEKAFEGKVPTYPIGLITPVSIDQNIESYATNQLARRGLGSIIDNDSMYSVKLLPALLELEIEYRTLRFSGTDDSVLSYIKRWLFARRIGSLKFNVDYGRLVFPIDVMPSSSNVAIPLRESTVEAETCYKIVTNITLKGYISEAELAQQGIVKKIVVNGVELNSDGSLPGAAFTPFNN